MKSTLSITLAVIIAILSVLHIASCRSDQVARHHIAEETLVAAKFEGIDYVRLYKQAMAGDKEAIGELMRISKGFDAAAMLGHRASLAQLRKKFGNAFLAPIAKRLTEEQQQRVAWLFNNEPPI